jgi:dTDP-4-amino-4,6-dideoxygalactose transaminase
MKVFNSLGSNYTPKMVWQSLKPSKNSALKDLEANFKSTYNAKQVVLTNKCREALVVIMRQLGLPAGSKVAINGFTCFVVYEAVEAAGLKPQLIDIAPNELNFSADSLGVALRADPTIRAVIIQNSLGLPADVLAIKVVCDKAGVALIEDLAHSAGLTYKNGATAGTIGTAAALSFGQNKIIDAAAGGAAIFKTPIAQPAEFLTVNFWQKITAYCYPLNTWIIRSTHHIGVGKVLLKVYKAIKIIPDPVSGYAGDIHALPAHQAALANKYLKDLPNVIKHRQNIAKMYREMLPANVQFKHFDEAIYIRFPLRVSNPKALSSYLKKYNIELGIPWYDAVVAPKRFMTKVDYVSGSCPNSEAVVSSIINLPTHINVSEETARLIAGKVSEWLKLS